MARKKKKKRTRNPSVGEGGLDSISEQDTLRRNDVLESLLLKREKARERERERKLRLEKEGPEPAIRQDDR